MSVLIDTPIWSLALRRNPDRLNEEEQRLVKAWSELVWADEAVLIGPVRQQVLSGVRDRKRFVALAERLEAFEDLTLEREDFVKAAKFFNTCRSHGIAGSDIDLTICAAAHRHAVPIFTVDTDFTRYARVLPIQSYKP